MRQIIVGVIGGTLLLLGFIGIVMPIMPGFIFIPLALAILAIEFAFAARWLVKIKKQARNTRDNIKEHGWKFWKRAKHPRSSHLRHSTHTHHR